MNGDGMNNTMDSSRIDVEGSNLAQSKSDNQAPVKQEEVNNEVPATTRQPRKRKKKVEIACVYCRRSHMICDDSRPCQRCIKRGIGHLCYDEPSNSRQRKKAAALRQSTTPSGPNSLINSPNSISVSTQQGMQDMSLDERPAIGPQSKPMPTQNMVVGSYNTNNQPKNFNNSVLSQTLQYNQEPFFYSEHAGSEFSSLNDFLSMIDDPDLVNGALNEDSGGGDQMLNFGFNNNDNNDSNINANTNSNDNGNSTDNNNVGNQNYNANPNIDIENNQANNDDQSNSNVLNNLLSFPAGSNLFNSQFPNDSNYSVQQANVQNQNNNNVNNSNTNQVNTRGSITEIDTSNRQTVKSSGNSLTNVNNLNQNPPIISDSARDKFFLTAADPTTEISPEERLKQVIKAKLEAGLLQPYNYAKGYARLQAYMDNYMNVSSRQRILKPLSIFRPAFRAIARTLKDVDLVLVEESFERMLLDYDRVFTSMAIPACLWRRTGEIYRGNKEFASLVGVKADDLKDGKLAIYELMSEESAVNFWEKYGAIAFDKGQKAVLTSCNLRTKDGIKRKSCCFSFTIRRDRYNIPSCIVGNFIPIDQ